MGRETSAEVEAPAEAETNEAAWVAEAPGEPSAVATVRAETAIEAPPRADAPPTAPAPSAADSVDSRIDALIRLGRSGEAGAFDTISASLGAGEPRVRAAAYQALGQLLEHDPARLEPHIRRGVADSDSRVRRRVVLAATAARGLDCGSLLEPLQRDPDSQVRRLVNEVLRRLSPGRDSPPTRTAADRDVTDEPAARVAGAQGS
jgi:hypothetical protein